MTAREVAQDIARSMGKKLTDEQADRIIWEFTGFPAFWNIPRDGDTPEECIRTQISRFLRDPEKCQREQDATLAELAKVGRSLREQDAKVGQSLVESP